MFDPVRGRLWKGGRLFDRKQGERQPERRACETIEESLEHLRFSTMETVKVRAGVATVRKLRPLRMPICRNPEPRPLNLLVHLIFRSIFTCLRVSNELTVFWLLFFPWNAAHNE